MSVAFKFEEGKFVIDTEFLLDAMTDEDKMFLVERLSCEDAVIKHVADQIIEGWTENVRCGARVCGTSEQVYLPLDVAARRIAEASGDIAANEIQALKDELKRTKDRLEKAHDELDRIRFPSRHL